MTKNMLGTAILAALVALVACRGTAPNQAEVRKETAYERVLRTGTIRAAYINYPPGSIKDPKTGNLSGIAIDALRKIAANLKLKVEFTEEVGWGTIIQGLEADRYDMLGSPAWANPIRGKLATLSAPIYYTGIGVWVRANEKRITPTNSWESINAPSIRIAAMDGSTPDVIAKTQFPKARLVSYPDLTGEQNLFLDLTHNKADVFFAEPAVALQFLRSNPNSIRNVAPDNPIRVFANIWMMKKGEFQLRQMLDVALQDIQNNGTLEGIIKPYEPEPGAFFRVAKPYR